VNAIVVVADSEAAAIVNWARRGSYSCQKDVGEVTNAKDDDQPGSRGRAMNESVVGSHRRIHSGTGRDHVICRYSPRCRGGPIVDAEGPQAADGPSPAIVPCPGLQYSLQHEVSIH